MKRREFINWAGLGLLASCLPVALVACAEENTTAADDSATRSISVGSVSQLEESGFLLDEESKILVVKDKSDRLMAVNPTCTHQGCTVEWQSNESKLLCPCHAAQFAPDGTVLAKPAQSPLETYQVRSENGEVIVRLA